MKNARIIYSNVLYAQYGGALVSIAGERKNKHTVDGVATLKHST